MYFFLLLSVYIWAAETLLENLVIQHINVPLVQTERCSDESQI